MATAPFIHARCSYTSRISNFINKSGSQQSPVASSSSHASQSSSSSSSASNSGFNFPSGTNSGQRHQGLRAHAMSTTTNGKSISSMGNSRNDPDHLLVLVHGILASTADWTYAEAELKRRLGKNFLIFGAPQALLQSCLTFGAFSFIAEGLNKRQAALALPMSWKTRVQYEARLPPVLPLQFPLPNEVKEAFSSFSESLKKRSKGAYPTSR